MMRPLFLRLMLALLLVAALPAVAQQAAPLTAVPVRGGLHEGHGRLVFDWPTTASGTARIEGSSLLVAFDRPLQADLSGALANLRGYLGGGSVAADNRTVSFALVNGDYQVSSFPQGASFVVDLRRQGAPQGTPQATPAPAATPAPVAQPAAPALAVRGADHTGYSRLVFDWNRPVDYTVERAEGRATIRFDRPARYETGTLNSRPLRNVQRIDPVAATEGRAVALQIPADARLRYFRSGTKIVVDVLDAQAGGAASAPQASAPQASAPQASAPQASAPQATPPQPPVPQATPPRTGRGQPTPPQAPPQARPPAPSVAATPPTPQPATPQISEPAAPAQSAGSAAAPAGSTALTPQLLTTSAPQRIRAPVAIDQLAGDAIPVTVRREGDMIALRFEWPQAVSAAVFRRAGHLWVAFDQGRRLDLSGLSATDNQVFSQPQQVAVPVGSLLRARLVEGVNPRVWRDGNSWVIELRAQTIRPDVPLAAEVQPISPQGPRLFIPVTGIGETIIVRDPEVGDEVNIVPLAPLGRGIDGERRFAEFELLPTVQGVAVVPLTDGVQIRQLPDGVAITSSQDGGLSLSRDVARREATFGEQSATGGLQNGRPFPMTQWRRGGRSNFYPERQTLQFAVAEATSIARTKPRLELAQFYFANGLSVEAQGLLRTIAIEDPDIANVPSFKALLGASYFAMGRYQEASDSLADRALDGNREIALWRGAAKAAMGDWNAAVEQFARAGEIPADYPRNYTTEIALLAAQAAIRVGDYRGAGEFLNVVAEGTPIESEMARINFLRGRVLAAAGSKDEAMELWRPLADGTDRWARIRAARAIIEEELAQGNITTGQALQRLEGLRFAWRGDELEFDLLRRMGELYLAENDYRNGLTTMREAVTLFPDYPESKVLAKTMTDSFVSLYLDGIADRMPPLTALALYDDFRELTPPGARGNEMIRRLADRLVAVDLLDRAANLLDRQVKFRLEGVDKARIGARLALIRLLDRRPDAAIGALDESNAPGLPVDLFDERMRLRARAVFDLSQPDEALALLSKDTSRDADLLRADILWRKQDWAAATGVFARLAAPLAAKPQLTDSEATTVLNWAIAASMSENTAQVVAIRQAHAPAMDNSPYREAFRLITNTTSGDLADLETLTQRFQDVQRFQSFLSNYREKLKNSQLSAIN